jgi:uncharacterized protein (TIGR02996 family)
MTTDEDCFRRACYARLRDDAPWCAYADWLRERGRDALADRLPTLRAMLRKRLPVAKRVALPIAVLLPED